MGAVLAFLNRHAERCSACGRLTTLHRVNGRWVGCRVDEFVMQDQARAARRVRLAQLQASLKRRGLTLRPFGIGDES